MARNFNGSLVFYLLSSKWHINYVLKGSLLWIKKILIKLFSEQIVNIGTAEGA